jgi:transcriptional regulator with XRE-family HTH domain
MDGAALIIHRIFYEVNSYSHFLRKNMEATMGQEHVAQTGEIIFSLIEMRYGSDAAFERAANLPPKTVNNWRRGRSSSYMKMLPELATLFSVSIQELMRTDASESGLRLSAEEQELLTLFRATDGLSEKERAALTETIRNTIDLYISTRGGQKK